MADTDCDGKMNIDEFSMACKLINLKLRGFEVPKSLPPTMIASLKAVGGTPILTPTAGMSPTTSLSGLSNIPPARPVLPVQLQQQPIAPQIPIEQPALIPGIGMVPQAIQQPANIIPMQPVQPAVIPSMPQPILPPPPTAAILPGVLPPQIIPQTVPVAQPPIVPMQPILNQVSMAPTQIPPLIQPIAPTNSALLIDSLVNVSSAPQSIVSNEILINTAPVAPLPAPPTPPSGTQSRSMSFSEKVPSIESPGSASGSASADWAVKSSSKLKYTQLFNTTDRTRSGFLTGAQARGILLQSKLPQATLAKVWGLSDMDSDGRLGCEEFVLAMYLCEMATQGEKIPDKLPPELIPPSFRKITSRHGSVSSATNSRHGSVSSQGAISMMSDADLAHYNQTSFEDKRKENYDKGQAELERRRRVLQDAERKAQEERERKERDEAEKKEKARLEVERRQQEELERQLQLQRELEQEREEKRKRELEQKEAARKEMEKQRQIGELNIQNK